MFNAFIFRLIYDFMSEKIYNIKRFAEAYRLGSILSNVER